MNGMPEAGKESLLCHATANEPANPAFMQQGHRPRIKAGHMTAPFLRDEID
jgi:hypothetical protein